MERMVILTDSLGMPREEIDIVNTWTDNILETYCKKYKIYISSKRALSTKDICMDMSDLLESRQPSIAIIQVGIVDACRRALPRKIHKLCNLFGGFFVCKLIRYLCKTFHYQITRIFEWRFVYPYEFEANIQKILSTLQAVRCQHIGIIKIAAPTRDLLKNTYAVENDVAQYNQILANLAEQYKFKLIDPYQTQSNYQTAYEFRDKPEILLPDGHHLTTFGNHLVFQSVTDYINAIGEANEEDTEKSNGSTPAT